MDEEFCDLPVEITDRPKFEFSFLVHSYVHT